MVVKSTCRCRGNHPKGCSDDGHSCLSATEELQRHESHQGFDGGDHYDKLTSFAFLEETQAQSLSILPSPCQRDDLGALHFGTPFAMSSAIALFQEFSHHANPFDGVVHHPWPWAQSQA